MKLTERQKFKILQSSSSHLLEKPYPDNWQYMEFTDQLEFVEQYRWVGMYLGKNGSDIIDSINDVAMETIQFVEKIL